MPLSPHHKFKFVTMLSALLLLAAATITVTLVLEHQQRQNTILSKLATELHNSARLMAEQAIRYQEMAPHNETASRLETSFYPDLMDRMSTFDRIAGAFIRQSFPPDLTGLSEPHEPDFPAPLLVAIDKLELTWLDYRQGLLVALGPDFDSPHLLKAAEYLIANQSTLDEISRNFSTAVQEQINQKNDHARRISVLAISTLLLAGIITLWFLLRLHRLSGQTN